MPRVASTVTTRQWRQVQLGAHQVDAHGDIGHGIEESAVEIEKKGVDGHGANADIRNQVSGIRISL
jgi:hypothetical protein